MAPCYPCIAQFAFYGTLTQEVPRFLTSTTGISCGLNLGFNCSDFWVTVSISVCRSLSVLLELLALCTGVLAPAVDALAPTVDRCIVLFIPSVFACYD